MRFIGEGSGECATVAAMAETVDKDAPSSASAVEVLSQTAMPVEVGDVELDEQGFVRQRTNDQPIRFDFVYRGVTFHAELPVDCEDGLLTLRAVVGVIPYSAENAVGRRAAWTILAHARLARGKLWCDNHMRVHMELRAVPSRPRTPVNVVATVVSLLMDALPYLDLLNVALRRPRRPHRPG
jgi:hypothetical protein